ncbi:IS4 family transposase [Myxococcota bacterium]|nr:IS4 family transposase [Myxococcota bacterium]
MGDTYPVRSKLSGGHQAVISASIVHKGRSIIIYNEVHSMRLLANPKIESKFIDNLHKHIVPEEAKPIIITDAGFRNPWFKKILAKGWDFVGRISLAPSIRKIDENEWKTASFYNDQKTHEARDCGEIEIAKTNPLRARLITIKDDPKKRKSNARVGKKRISKNGHTANVYRNRYKNAALIITSIRNLPAKSIYKLYSKRMQIEESFRAIKSSRFGYGQENTYTLKHKRLDVIFLLASLAMFVQILLGTLVEHFNLSKHFQSNTQSDKRAISIARLGKLVAQCPKIVSKWNITWISFAIKLSRTFGTMSFVLESNSH